MMPIREEPKAPVYVDGEHHSTLKGEGLVDEFKTILDDYVRTRYGKGGEGRREERGEGDAASADSGATGTPSTADAGKA